MANDLRKLSSNNNSLENVVKNHETNHTPSHKITEKPNLTLSSVLINLVPKNRNSDVYTYLENTELLEKHLKELLVIYKNFLFCHSHIVNF